MNNVDNMENYTNTSSNQEENVKISHNQCSKAKVPKKAIAISLAIGVGLGSFATTQIAGRNYIVRNVSQGMSEDTWNKFSYEDDTEAGYILVDNGTKTQVDNQDEYIGNFYNSFQQQGYSADEMAIALDYRIGVGIKRYTVPGTTLIGRINAKNQAFLESINLNENNQTEGISR